MAWEQIKNKNGGRTRGGSTSCTLSANTGKKDRHGGIYRVLRISIPAAVLQQCRWFFGDRLDVFVDRQTRAVLLKWTIAGGVSICPNVGKTSEHLGKNNQRGSMQITIDEVLFASLPRAAVPCTHEVTPEGLVVKMVSGLR